MSKFKPMRSTPKIGDKVRYIGFDTTYVTNGEEYVVVGLEDGVPYVIDDHGDREFINSSEHGNYEAVAAEYVGYIVLAETVNDGEYGTLTLTLEVDALGKDSIDALVKASADGRERHELETQLAAIQAKLDKLDKEEK